MLANIAVQNADCFKESDKSNIFKVVAELPDGENTINDMVCALLRENVSKMMRSGINDLGTEAQMLRRLDLTEVCRKQNKLDEAMTIMREIIYYFKKSGGTNLGRVYHVRFASPIIYMYCARIIIIIIIIFFSNFILLPPPNLPPLHLRV
jgi:hypothetical protein